MNLLTMVQPVCYCVRINSTVIQTTNSAKLVQILIATNVPKQAVYSVLQHTTESLILHAPLSAWPNNSETLTTSAKLVRVIAMNAPKMGVRLVMQSTVSQKI